MDKYFMPAGDLDDEDKNIILPKGNIENLEPVKNSMENVGYFKPAGDLIEENHVISNNKIDNIDDYLLTIVSGKKYPSVCELGVLMESGRMIVNFDELKEMVNSGYNIVSANVLNADKEIIEVEIQKYVYDEELMEKRRRF